MVCADPDCATIAALNSVNKHEYFCIVKDQLTLIINTTAKANDTTDILQTFR